MPSIYHTLCELEQTREPAALCTVTLSQGSTPRRAGSKMLVYEDGRIVGTVGGGELENRVIQAALQSIQENKTQTIHYNMTDPARGDPGVCGGQVEVFVEPILPPAMALVIGAGHVGKAVVHLAKWLGFRVAVSDDRAGLCTPESIPEADEYFPVEMSQLTERLKITNQTYIVATTRGSNVDAEGLPNLIDSNAAYIGVIGSKRRWATTVKALKEKGIAEEKIARIHSPMGLELNAETPEEIAVSIMAEILMVRDKGTGKTMKG